MISGLLTEVQIHTRGSAASADVATGATEVPLEDVTDFTDYTSTDTVDPTDGTVTGTGGIVDINGTRYTYTSVTSTDDGSVSDEDGIPGTITLDTALSADVAEADPVLVIVGSDVATDAYAVVDFSQTGQTLEDEPDPDLEADGDVAGAGDSVLIPIDYAQRAVWPEGQYDPPVPVEVADDLSAILDAPGAQPVIDGSTIMNLPDTSVPTEPPASTPALTVSAGPDFFLLRVDNTAADWASATIEYHASTDPAFVPTAGDPTTLLGASRGVMVTNALPDGTAYALDTQYAFAAIATNEAGSAAPTPTTTAQLDPTALTNVIASQIVAGFILTGRVQFGQGYIDANEGLVLPQPDGTVTQFPVDGVTPATISGFLIANGMTMKDGAYFYGLSQIVGKFLLNSGVPDPSKKPTWSFGWPAADIDSGSLGNNIAPSQDGANLVSFSVNPTSKQLSYCVRDKTTLDTVVQDDIETNTTLTVVSSFRVGSTYYVFGQDSAQANAWVLRGYDAAAIEAGTPPAKLSDVVIATSTFVNGLCAGTDGTSLLIAYVNSNNHLIVNSRNLDGTGITSIANLTVDKAYRIGGVTRIPGSASGVLVMPTNGKVWSINLADGTENTYYEFTPAATPAFGLTWDGANLRSLAYNTVYTYSNHAGDGNALAAYTWYDGDEGGTGTHETKASPTATVTWPARTYATVTASAAPHADVVDPTQTDKANIVRIYAAFATNGTLTLRATLPVGSTSYTFSVESAGSSDAPDAPTIGTFDTSNVAAGDIESQALDANSLPLVRLVGDGSWRLGQQLAADKTGQLVGPNDTTVLNRLQEVTSTSNVTLSTGTWKTVASWGNTYSNFYYASLSSGVMTMKAGGVYMCTARVQFTGATSAGRRIVRFTVNGTEYARSDVAAGGVCTVPLAVMIPLNAGDVLGIDAYQSSGGDLALAANPGHMWQLMRLSPI